MIITSYQRALALHRFWKDEAGIDFSNMPKCELVISGSGEGGVPRFGEEDYMNIHAQEVSVPSAGHDTYQNAWEKYNQRFLIHIVPVIGNIRMDE